MLQAILQQHPSVRRPRPCGGAGACGQSIAHRTFPLRWRTDGRQTVQHRLEHGCTRRYVPFVSARTSPGHGAQPPLGTLIHGIRQSRDTFLHQPEGGHHPVLQTHGGRRMYRRTKVQRCHVRPQSRASSTSPLRCRSLTAAAREPSAALGSKEQNVADHQPQFVRMPVQKAQQLRQLLTVGDGPGLSFTSHHAGAAAAVVDRDQSAPGPPGDRLAQAGMNAAPGTRHCPGNSPAGRCSTGLPTRATPARGPMKPEQASAFAAWHPQREHQVAHQGHEEH